MNMNAALLALVSAMITGGAERPPIADEFIAIIEPRTAVQSFRGFYVYRYNFSYEEQERHSENIIEYRCTDEDTFCRAISTNQEADGLRERRTYVYYGGEVKKHYDKIRSDDSPVQSVSLALMGKWEEIGVMCENLAPGRVLGEVGKKVKNVPSSHGLPLAEYLRAEGPFYYYEQDGFRILCHNAYIGAGDFPIAADVWLDKNNDLVRIDFVSRAWDIPEEIIKKYYGGEFFELRAIRRSLKMSGHFDAGNGLRFPAQAVEEGYYKNEEKYHAVLERYQDADIPPDDEKMIRLLALEMELGYENEAIYEPEKCAFNVPMTPEDFRLDLPASTLVYRDFSSNSEVLGEARPWWKQHAGMVLAAAILLTAIGAAYYFGRNRFGWR